MSDPSGLLNYHATCVSVDGNGLLVLGASGTGKSALALQLMALGAELVSDDRTCLRQENNQVVARAPAAIKGLIEARGIGILNAHVEKQAKLVLVVDLDQIEQERLPSVSHHSICGIVLPLLKKVDGPHFPAAILQLLRSGRWDQG